MDPLVSEIFLCVGVSVRFVVETATKPMGLNFVFVCVGEKEA